MENIKRPQPIASQDNIIQTDENRQEFTEQQFKAIYDKLDEIVQFINSIK